MKTMVIGGGTIGEPLAARLAEEDQEVLLVTRNSGVSDINRRSRFRLKSTASTLKSKKDIADVLDEFIEGVDVAFVAIPTINKGKTELAYIEYFRSRGVPIIIFAKGAFAYQYAKLQPHLDHIGRRAVVGGRAGLLHWLRGQHVQGKRITVHGVVNASNNKFMSEVSNGNSLVESFRMVKLAQLAEPGAADVVSFVNGELRDTIMKMCALYNDGIAPPEGPFVTPDNLPKPIAVSFEDLQAMTLPTKKLRPVIRLTNSSTLPLEFEKDLPGSMYGEFGEFRFSMGFYDLGRNDVLASWTNGESWNGLRIQHDDGGEGPLAMGGLGAGPGPTIGSALNDLYDFCRNGTVKA